MASIFTFDPDPPRVASPWLTSAKHSPTTAPRRSDDHILEDFEGLLLADSAVSTDVNVTGLDAEPQQGPTEYKLHLLLRPRRGYAFSSTSSPKGGTVGSTPQLRPLTLAPVVHRSLSGSSSVLDVSAAISSTASQQLPGSLQQSTPYSSTSRQHRLEQLTTQLLWRLQQSSPHHTSSAGQQILPEFPEATTSAQLLPPRKLSRLLPGLEESRGALYEIGVTDDGTFIGLTKDEMLESLNNLRAMAACLGCSVEVLRMVRVGECEWYDETHVSAVQPETTATGLVGGGGAPLLRKDRLYVAEAYVKPELDSNAVMNLSQDTNDENVLVKPNRYEADVLAAASAVEKEQLRISFTGATNGGKSSLLGTLSTSTLDNGRGKSRLSLLRHRHELASGMTSSVSQELIGYSDEPSDPSTATVINYASEGVATWTDIHNASTPGRLVLLSDSAGHPRYRRTALRGIMSWAPHWTLLCVSATDELMISDQESFSAAGAGLSMAHLQMCLCLELPLIVAITKFDVATKLAFRQLLSAVLTTLKAAGRIPLLLPAGPAASSLVDEADLQIISAADLAEARDLANKLHDNPKIVPILFTSAVKGVGIAKLHAILASIRIPSPPSVHLNSGASILFNVDDSFRLRHSDVKTIDADHRSDPGQEGVIVSGYSASGSVSVGDELLIGPFSYSTLSQDRDMEIPGLPPSNPEDPFLTPRSFPDAMAKLASFAARARGLSRDKEWRRVKVISIRNLRLPVRQLRPDQAGTIALMPLADASGDAAAPLAIRKGLVLTNGSPAATLTFTASFHISEAGSVIVGSLVVLYFASVRASAKVLAVSLHDPSSDMVDSSSTPEESVFGFEFDADNSQLSNGQDGPTSDPLSESIRVSFQFLTSREYLEIGARVLVMSGGGTASGNSSHQNHAPGAMDRAVSSSSSSQNLAAASSSSLRLASSSAAPPGVTSRGFAGGGGLDGFVGRIVERLG